MPSLRLPRLSRSPLLFWVAVAALALVTASVVAGAMGRAESLAARYGPLRPMVVAARPVDRGAVLAGADLSVRRVPASFLADGSVASVEEARGRVVVFPLVAGEPVFRTKLAPEGLSGVAALLPAGRRAVAVPTDGSASPVLAKGDVVDVLATFEAEAAVAVAVDATVVDVGPESATLAVTPAEAGAVAFALAHGDVTVVLTPGPGPGSGPSGSAPGPAQSAPGPGQRNLVASTPSTTAPATRR